MLTVVLKYLIADWCIDAFFNQAFKGLQLDASNSTPKLGDIFTKISHNYSNETYYDCKVIDIESIKELPGEFIVYVRYSTKSMDSDNELVSFDEITPDLSGMSDVEVREYVHTVTGEVMDGMSREELEEIIYDDDVDMRDVDLVETDDEFEVGLSTVFFTFFK